MVRRAYYRLVQSERNTIHPYFTPADRIEDSVTETILEEFAALRPRWSG
jgi:hypothetical protein